MKSRRIVRWVVSALGVVVAVLLIRQFGGSETVEHDGLTFAAPELAEALELGAESNDLRVLAKFANTDGAPCRAFLAPDISGIACKERGGWHMRVIRGGVSLDDPAGVAATEAALRRRAAEIAAQ